MSRHAGAVYHFLLEQATVASCPDVVAGALLRRAAIYNQGAAAGAPMLERLLQNAGSLVDPSRDAEAASAEFARLVTASTTEVVATSGTEVKVLIGGELLGVPEKLLNLAPEVTRVLLEIDSVGGSLIAAENIAKAIGDRHVTGKVVGNCLSAAAFLLQQCQHRTATAHSVLMIHAPTIVVCGGLAELEARMADLQAARDRAYDLLIERTNQPPEVVASWFDGRDWFWNAEGALEAGLLDEILP